MPLYSLLLMLTIGPPLILSFDKKLQFYRQWKYLIPSLFIIGMIYILFDIWFTNLGVWGFNPLHHSSLRLFGLPIEEWLFFLIIPYASIFLHESLILYFPTLQLSEKITRVLTIILIALFTLLAVVYMDKIYTLYMSTLMAVALSVSLFDSSQVIRTFFITFIFLLIPFVVVNGLLTGSFAGKEVVWYNNAENLGIRFLTIPIEDFGYAFSLLLLNLMLAARLKQRAHE
ncbi:MAG TPA: lycopene cyclase domain-containing protein [Prolixibacteraceae bacterium]|nr:lycopene cyclase domain-containing protein [Prolixibacteraceae bacterium]